MAVTVTAIRTFPHAGRTVRKGEVLDIASPVEASVMARKGLISLSRIYRTKVESADPEPEPEAPKRRRYRRRDMQAEHE